MAEILRIEILNWERYQARDRSRHKIENPTWFKFFNRFIRSGTWGTPATTRVLAITLLVLVNEQGSDNGVVVLSRCQLTALALLRSCQVDAGLVLLMKMGFLEFHELADETARQVRPHKKREEKIRSESAEIEGSSEPEKNSKLPPGILADVRQIQKTGKPNEVNDEEKT